jgi:protein-glutamine gamma-glutamyltransferase
MGASLLFWGAMTDRPLIGILLAVLTEASSFIRTRWDFDESSWTKAWQFSVASIAVAAVLIWLDGNRLTALPMLITWLPLLLIPVQFVQIYGIRPAISLNTFSFLAKQRRLRNRRLGLMESEIFIHFGNLYFVVNLIAATLGSQASSTAWVFLLGCVILTGWMLRSFTQSSFVALLFPLVIASGLAVAGQIGLDRLEQWITSGGGSGSSSESKFDPNSMTTQIGKAGKIQQSNEILWRLKTEANSRPPTLLRTASYQQYRAARWENPHMNLAEGDFKDLATRGVEPYYIVSNKTDELLTRNSLPRFNLRGGANALTPLPLPCDTDSLRDFAVDSIEQNRFGTVRVFPKETIIDGTVLWRSNSPSETAAGRPQDLKIDRYDALIIQQTAKEIGLLEDAPLAVKLVRLRAWFARNFHYTRDLTIRCAAYTRTEQSGIKQFLTTNRNGHCEYFATAATLLLREAGIPTRYAVGYSVMELNSKRQEYVIRGIHAHAWCRVWDETTAAWSDFDPTPATGMLGGQPTLPWSQSIADALKRVREDFFLWRNQPANRLRVILTISVIALGIFIWIGRKLWRGHKMLTQPKDVISQQGLTIRTPLHELESIARQHLGPRPRGQPFAVWLLRLRSLMPDPTPLEAAVSIHQRLRYDPNTGAQSDETARLKELIKPITISLSQLAKTSPLQ